MAAIIPCDKCIHGKVCAMGFQFRRETANVTIVCKDFVRKTDVAPRAEVAREIFEDLLRDITHGLEIARTTRKKFLHNIERNHIWVYHYDGEIKALEGIECLIAELKKKYTEGQK